jgi:hypothetical protein
VRAKANRCNIHSYGFRVYSRATPIDLTDFITFVHEEKDKKKNEG